MKKLLTLIFLSMIAFNSIHAEITWTLSDGTLTISGTDMPDYAYGNAPWYSISDKFKKVIIEKGVTNIGNCAFLSCSVLTSITIPNTVTSIGSGVFDGCSSLTSVTIPNSVTSIGEYAFYNCSGLTSITIGNSVTSIGKLVFCGCTGLTSIIVEDGNKKYDSRNNCNAIIEKESNTLIAGCKKTVIPNSVTSIGSKAFDGCSSLTSITIPNSVTSIEKYAFAGCSDLTSITIGNSVTSIGDYAFWCCSGITSITIPNSVESIGMSAFEDCLSLTSVTIPKSVTSIENSAFSGCSGLTSIIVEDENKKYDSRNNCNAIIEKESNTLIAGCKRTVIPNSVTSIGDRAFYGCSNLTSVTIPNSVTSIGNSAFNGCTSLSSITIPNTTSIGGNAFYGTKWYENQPDGLVYIGLTLYKYKGFMPENAKIFIKEGIKEIAGEAFAYCSNLASITIPNSVTSIGGGAFCNCYSLTSITIPNSVTSIGESAFESCSSLISITIPNSVTSIGKLAFGGCSCLTSITIPNSVTSIGDYAFEVYNLNSITCEATTPPSCQENCFYNIKYVPLYVPYNSVKLYKNAIGWKTFYKILPIGGYTVTLDHNKGIGDPEHITVVYNQPMPEDVGLIAPTRKGYDFTGYSSGDKYYYDANLKSVRNYDYKKDYTLYANWKAHTSKINLDFQGGKNGTSKIIATYDSAMPTGINIVAPTRNGYTFGGYYDNTDGNGTQYYNANMTSKIPWDKDVSEITLYAKWIVIPVIAISLNVETVSLWVGDTKELSATATPSTAYNTAIGWSSSNNNVASISSDGVITAKGKGTCTITCTAADGYGAKTTCKVTVKRQVAEIALSETTASLWVGKTKTITATISPTTANNTAVNWSSSDNSVATVSSKGVITAKGKGTCIITCTAADGYGTKSTCEVTVKQQVTEIALSETNASLWVGDTKTITATALPTTASNTSVEWSSSDDKVASVSSEGAITANGEGSCIITCTAADGYGTKSTCKVTVKQQVTSIDFGYETLTMTCGDEKPLTPTINPSNADVKTLTWKSTDNSVATITSEGVLTAVNPGTATITCTATDDFKKSSSITVIVESLDITITDKNPTIKEGTYREGGISYTRTLTKNKYTTFCMPYDVNLSDYTDYFSNVYVPMEMAFVKSGGKLMVMFKSVSITETIRAGQPFIALASKSGTVTIKNSSKVKISSLDEPQPTNLEVYNYGGNLLARNTDVDVTITGNYSIVTDLDNANNFTFSVNGQIVSTTTVSPYRFYITKNDERSSAKITDIQLSFDGEEATGIEDIINEQKGDDKYYNLNGQRINKSNAQKGVYIINGKKYAK